MSGIRVKMFCGNSSNIGDSCIHLAVQFFFLLLPCNERNPSYIMVQNFETCGIYLLVQILNLQAILGGSVLVHLCVVDSIGSTLIL